MGATQSAPTPGGVASINITSEAAPQLNFSGSFKIRVGSHDSPRWGYAKPCNRATSTPHAIQYPIAAAASTIPLHHHQHFHIFEQSKHMVSFLLLRDATILIILSADALQVYSSRVNTNTLLLLEVPSTVFRPKSIGSQAEPRA